MVYLYLLFLMLLLLLLMLLLLLLERAVVFVAVEPRTEAGMLVTRCFQFWRGSISFPMLDRLWNIEQKYHTKMNN